MGLEEVKKEILEKAGLEAKRIISEARGEAEAITKDTEKQVSDYKERSDKEALKLIETIERKEKAGAEFDAKKLKLDRKKELVDAAFNNVKKTLAKMPEKKREEYIKKLIDKAKKEIDVAYVYANSNDRKIVERIPGIKYKEAEIVWGIIAENIDGSIRVDYSYEEVLDSVEKENMQEIATKLFG